PRRATFLSNTVASGPVSNKSVFALSPRHAVMAQDKPCAAQHRHWPDRIRPPLLQNRRNSFSTNSGAFERLSVELSTRTRTSARSAMSSSPMLCVLLTCGQKSVVVAGREEHPGFDRLQLRGKPGVHVGGWRKACAKHKGDVRVSTA